jgi:Flp pilus assembly protein TadG
MQKQILSRHRHHERGQTMVFVAISIVSLLAMAALAIDIVTLYASRSEIQRAADAAALAGAKAIADSGFTTLPSADPNYSAAQGLAQTMAVNAVNAMILTPSINPVAGGQATFALPPAVDLTGHPGSYQVTVSLKKINLPTFFSKIWGQGLATVTATATAEAYNPANLPTFTPISPKSVKPWLVANSDPATGVGFIDPTGSVELNLIGKHLTLHSDCSPLAFPLCSDPLPGHTLPDNPPTSNTTIPGHPYVDYVPALITTGTSNVCPACEGSTDYERSIECADVATSYQVLSCGGGASHAQWDNTVSPGGAGGLSDLGAECLIHASGRGSSKGQDILDPSQWPNNPIQITAQSGPQNGNLVTTSNSIVTIPIIDTTSPIPATGGAVTIVGYMQAFIDDVYDGGPPSYRGDIELHVLNIAGCSATNNGANPVVGGSGTSPVPVRLITAP